MPVERLDPQLGKNPEIEIEIGIEIEKAASAWIAPPKRTRTQRSGTRTRTL